MAGVLPPIPPTPFADEKVTIRFVVRDDAGNENELHCHFQPLLTIPKRHLSSFQLTGENWLPLLRYITFAITNSEGTLARNDIPTVSLTDNDLPWLRLPGQPAELVFTCQNPSLADAAMLEGISASHASAQDSDFCNRIVERDGQNCLFTGASQFFCQAIHLIQCNKGGDYMSLLSEAWGGKDIENVDVDDERNGLFVKNDVHILTGDSSVVILKTPIPGFLETADVTSAVPPGQPMYTLQYFLDIYNPLNRGKVMFPPNLSVPIPRPTVENTPPDFLLTACYGSMCLRTWGPSVKEVMEAFGGMSNWYGRAGAMRRGEYIKEEKDAQQEAKEKARSDQAKRGHGSSDFDAALPSYTEDGQLIFPGSAEIEALSGEEIYDLFFLYLSLPQSIKPRPTPTPSIDSGLQERIKTWREDLGVV